MKSVTAIDGSYQREHGNPNASKEDVRGCLWCGAGILERLHQRFCCDDCCRLYNNPSLQGGDEVFALLEVNEMNIAIAKLPGLLGTPKEVNTAERIREAALVCGAKLLAQVEASRKNADRSGQLTQYWHVYAAMTEHIARLRAERRADWWIAHVREYADDRCWKETLRDLLDIRDECQQLAPA
jgi:hypothetical protein